MHSSGHIVGHLLDIELFGQIIIDLLDVIWATLLDIGAEGHFILKKWNSVLIAQ